jgi:hypothetical protein
LCQASSDGDCGRWERRAGEAKYGLLINVEDDGSACFVGDEGEGGIDDDKRGNMEQTLELSM